MNHRMESNGAVCQGFELVILQFIANCFGGVGGVEGAVIFFFDLIYGHENIALPVPEEFDLFNDADDLNLFRHA